MSLSNLKMITEDDISRAMALSKYLGDRAYPTPPLPVDRTFEAWHELVIRMADNLQIAAQSYRKAGKDDLSLNYYTASCQVCGWWGSSRLLIGGGQIADTGDYGDAYCPVCRNSDTGEK